MLMLNSENFFWFNVYEHLIDKSCVYFTALNFIHMIWDNERYSHSLKYHFVIRYFIQRGKMQQAKLNNKVENQFLN